MERELKGRSNTVSNHGLSLALFAGLLAGIAAPFSAEAQIYKIVDKDGNVTYTDQSPGDGTEPMDLPELSVVSTDYDDATATTTTDPLNEEEQELSRQDLRKLYRDCHISRPEPEETFWGTGNAVVLAWECSEPLREGLSMRFNIDGAAQTASGENMMGVTLDRGAHTVSATIIDERGRPLFNTDTVTFYVHQASIRNN